MSTYAWAAGHDVADGSLVSIETDLASYMNGLAFAIRSQPVNRFPVRTKLMNGSVRGDGWLTHTLIIAKLSREAMNYIQDTYLTNGTVVSQAMTVRLRLHDQDAWQRYNCYFELYNPDDDGAYELGEFNNVQLRFHNLEAL